MHLPDGFLTPSTWVPATLVSAGLWTTGIRRAARSLDPGALPRVGVLTAVAFVLMLLSIPLPGGSTVHFTGVATLSILFGAGTAFLCVSLVLLLQAMLMGAGGITSLGLSALLIGGLGGVMAAVCWRGLRGISRRAAMFVGAWTSVVLSALALSVVLGLQPRIGHDALGHPLFFPFGWSVVIPAVVVPHLALGAGEGILTVLLVEAYERATGERIP